MSGDAGAVVNGTQEASHLLDSFERCPSEHAKTVFILDELVPWIQGKHCSDLDISLILEFLIPKYASFQTRHILAAFHTLFNELYSLNKSTFLSTITRTLSPTITHVTLKSNAPSNYHTLLDWVNHTLLLSVQDNQSFTKYLPDLILWQSTLLTHCLAESHKRALRVSALQDTRMCLRGIFQQSESIWNGNAVESYVRVLMGAKVPAFVAAVGLGVLADVCKRLKNDTPREVIESSKSAFYEFFVKELCGSKIRVPLYVMNRFVWFFDGFTTHEDFDGILTPALDRGLLRSPELVLMDIIPPLCIALCDEIDFSQAVSKTLLPQLISSIKSTKVNIREASQQATFLLVSRCHHQDAVKTIVETLMKTLKDERSVDTRIALIRVIEGLPKTSASLSSYIVDSLTAIFAKETNETAILAMTDALMTHQGVLFEDNIAMDDKVTNLVTVGLSDKRSKIKASWATSVSHIIWNTKTTNLSIFAFSKHVSKHLFSVFAEVAVNGVQASQNGTIVGGYAVGAATLGRWSEWKDTHLCTFPLWNRLTVAQLVKSEGILKTITAVAPKPSFLLNERIYTKLTVERDQLWAINALEAAGMRDLKDMGIAWSIAAVYFIVNPKLSRSTRSAAVNMVEKVVLSLEGESRCDGVDNIVLGMEDWLHQLAEERKESPAMTVGGSSLLLLKDLLNSILSDTLLGEASYVNHVLIRLFVLAHHPQLPRYQWSWVDIARRANVDPGNLAMTSTSEFMRSISEKSWPIEKDLEFQTAAFSACGTLAFISPETAIPLLVDQVTEKLSPSVYNWIGPIDIQIWKASEGVAVIDVLQKPSNGIANRAGKTQKKGDWEAELRAELEKKKGGQTKLSAKDQALVNEQLAKEFTIRSRVEETRQVVMTGLGIVRNLIDIPAALGIELWYFKVLTILLQGVVQKCGGFVGTSATDVYLDMSKLTDQRLGFFKIPIGVALLRNLKVPEVPENWTEEPLTELNLRVLYRLRFLSEQRPLDLTSFQYCLPLALEILDVGKQTDKERTEKEEQITLVLEFLSFQATLCDNQDLPRMELIQKLLDVLLIVPAMSKLARDTFLQVTDAISANETKEEMDVLVSGLLKPAANVRNAVLQALEPFDLEETEHPEIVFLALHDPDERNSELATTLYETNSISLDFSGSQRLFTLLEHEVPYVRETAAKALATALPARPELFTTYLTNLVELYQQKAKPVPPRYDKYGMLVKEVERLNPAKIRLAIALALQYLAPVMPAQQVEYVLDFLVNKEALGDSQEEVREKMLTAGLAIIEAHGKERLEGILNILNGYLDAPAKSSDVHDRIREASVILLGGTARHLDPTDPRTDSIIDKLLATLKTPSESVQTAVCDCLPPLIRARLHRVPEHTSHLMDTLTSAPKYAERRGAAFGIAGTVAGAGIGSLYSSDILSRLATAVLSKRDAKSREGALFAYEALLYSLGRLFEPFVTQILPYLLVTYGDSSAEVRAATSDTAKMIMRTISGHCVKEILPSLLAGLEEPQWRSKKGSIEMLGAMAYLAPKQLSISLPTVVPRLTGVLTDSHPQVRTAANSSLLQFGEVISNPEIQDMVPILLKALGDPNKFTEAALDKLLSTAFIHYIDGPSLALLLPIITRGLKERNASTRRKSARILGSLGNLTDQRDLITYLTELLPPLRDILSDAIPENRASAAASLGLLVEKLGEDSFPDLIDSLMDDLNVDSAGIGRLGSAQALSEILSALGLHRLEDVLPDILNATENNKYTVREAFINLLVYLPATFGNRFQPYLAQTVPKILIGLADDVDVVREASLRAGRIVVTNYAVKAVDILLPELEKAFFDDRWQIRHSSVELVGTMMYQLVGINKRPEGEEDEPQEEATESQRAALVQVLGQERRDRILSALYIARHDISGIVRIAAAQVFKTLVSNPQKTVREMLPTMTNMIVKSLSSTDDERRQSSARTLGDIVRKFGQGTFSELLPVLQEGLHSHDAAHVQGICVALVEIMNSASKDSLDTFQGTLCDTVREALQHPNPEVQKAAAETFEALQQVFPSKAIESIIPTLLRQLESENESESEIALVALKEIMKTRSNARILGSLLPSLTAVPISPVNAKALGSLSEAAGDAIYPRLASILQNFMDSLTKIKEAEWVDALTNSFQVLILSVDEVEGIRIVLTTLFSGLRHENPIRRGFAIAQAGVFFKETDEDFSRYASQWATALVNHFAERDEKVVQYAIQSFNAMTGKLQPDELEACVGSVRQAVLSVGVEDRDLHGFVLPGGLSGVLGIYLAGIKRSSAEDGALGIAEMVRRTNLASLKPVTVQMIGALIRAIGERHPSAGKTAILHALATLLQKAPLFAKPFIPQLQRTAVKNLSDSANSDVRNEAAVVLGALIPMQPRVDPLVTELLGAANASVDDGVKFAVVKALCEVFSKAGKSVGESQKKAVSDLIHEIVVDGRGQLVAITVRLMSLLMKFQSAEATVAMVCSEIIDVEPSKNSVVALNGALLDPPSSIVQGQMLQEMITLSLSASRSTDDYISEACILAIGKIMTNNSISKDVESTESVFTNLRDIIRQPPSGSTDSQRLSLVVIRTTCRKDYELIQPYIVTLVGATVACARDSNVLPLKVAAEHAFMAMFKMESEGTTLLDGMLENMDAPLRKIVQEYTKRISGKIAALESSVDGDLAEDEVDDEREIASVGGMAF